MKRKSSRLTLAVRFVIAMWFAAVGIVRAQVASTSKPSVMVINSGYRLVIDAKNGSIESLRSTFTEDHNLLIPGHASLPLFKIEFLDDHGAFKAVTSSEAKAVAVEKQSNDEGETLRLDFREIGQLPVDARVTVRCPAHESLTYWSMTITNRTSWWIGHIQFPVVEVPFDTPANHNSSHILWSFADGGLAGPVEPAMSIGAWGSGNTTHRKSGASTTTPVNGLRPN